MTLDFTGLSDEETFHEYLSKTLDFPGYYGFNLDAMWDCLGDYVIDHPGVTLKIVGLAELESWDALFTAKVRKIFLDLETKFDGLKIAGLES